MSSSAEAYWKVENLCASKFYYEKKKAQAKKSAAVGKALDAVEAFDEEDPIDLTGAEKASIKDIAMQKSHLRWVNEKDKIHKIFPKNQKH